MKLGAHGEQIAARFLKRQGYRILRSNYTCPGGELDLVAADGDTLVFVEVKTRRSDAAADPENSVNAGKRRKVIRAARHFVAEHRAGHLPARFDVVAIVLAERGEPEIEHFVDAFQPAR